MANRGNYAESPELFDSRERMDGLDVEGDKQVVGRQLWRVIPLIKPYWKRFTAGVTMNAGARAFDLLPFVAIGLFVDAVQTPGAEVELYLKYSAMILLAFTGLAIFQGLSNYSWETLAQYLQHDLRMLAFGSLIKMEIRYFEDRQAGDIMSVLSADVNQLEDFLSDGSTSIIRIFVTFMTTFVILTWMSIKLTILLFLPILLIIPIVYFFSTRVQSKFRRSRQSFGDINSVLANNIAGMATVQAYTAEEYEFDRVSDESSAYKYHAIGATKSRLQFLPAIYIVAGIAFGVLVGVGGYFVNIGEISTGQLVTFLLLSTRMMMPMWIMGVLINQIQKSEASARRIFAMVDLDPSIVDSDSAKLLDKPIDKLSFNNIHFTYPNGEKVLNGVSFELNKNQTIGIVGPTGSGKSTTIKLLLRYYEPDSGNIGMNDDDIQELTLESMRKQIGYVSQDVYLFHGTVRENIAYGDFDATMDSIEESARLAGAHGFIEEMPKGYDTIVGERGVKLSGGQRQRISLARSLLRKPSLLVLDEATSSVDTKTEEIIQQNLNSFKEGRMTVAVAHRLSTIRNADLILVLVEGVVVERGLHDELIDQGGVYSDLWAVQSGSTNFTEEE